MTTCAIYDGLDELACTNTVDEEGAICADHLDPAQLEELSENE